MLNLSLSRGFRDHAVCHIDRTGTGVNVAQLKYTKQIVKLQNHIEINIRMDSISNLSFIHSKV